MPALMAATWWIIGLASSFFSRISRSTAHVSATMAPVMDAVRVPPSASSTSQSSVIVRSPSAFRSTAWRRERPISRWISTLRPSFLMPSLFLRSVVDAGSIAYSAVIQPCPLSRRNGGTASSTLAVQITRVFPVAIRQLPYAVRTKSVSIVTGRFSSGCLPSALIYRSLPVPQKRISPLPRRNNDGYYLKEADLP